MDSRLRVAYAGMTGLSRENDGQSIVAGILRPMRLRSCILALFALALCACGLRGPLYLPGDKQPGSEQAEPGNGSGKSRRPAPAPQAQKDGNQTPAQSTAPPDPDRPADVPIIPPGN